MQKIFEKIFENFQTFSYENLGKCIILADFSQHLRNYALIFCAFGQKRQFIGNFEKIFETSEKISKEKSEKCIILANFSNKLTNYAFIFCAFGRKTQIVGKF